MKRALVARGVCLFHIAEPMRIFGNFTILFVTFVYKQTRPALSAIMSIFLDDNGLCYFERFGMVAAYRNTPVGIAKGGVSNRAETVECGLQPASRLCASGAEANEPVACDARSRGV